MISLPPSATTRTYTPHQERKVVSEQKHPAALAAPLPAIGLPSESTVPLARHRAKLEECAQLHAHIQATTAALRIAQQTIAGKEVEYSRLLAEATRLQDVLNLVTAELQTKQQRVRFLEGENHQLRRELVEARSGPLHGSSGADTAPTRSATASWMDHTQGLHLGEDALRSTVRESVQASLCHSPAEGSPKEGEWAESRLPALEAGDCLSAAGHLVLAAYTAESFRLGCEPHVQVLHSLYRNGDALVAVQPPITFAQLSVLHRLLERPASPSLGDTALSTCMNSTAAVSGGTCGSVCTTAHWDGWTAAAVFSQWGAQLRSLSFRCEESLTGVSLVAQLLPLLPSVCEVEVFALASTAAMQRLAEVLLMSPSVSQLSLPELVLDDDGIHLLWQLLKQREAMAGTDGEPLAQRDPTGQTHAECVESTSWRVSSMGTNVTHPKVPSVPLASRLCLHTLDLSACHLSCSLSVTQLCCPGLEVLLLPGCEAVTDASVHHVLLNCPALHTIDFSGCSRLTTAGLQGLNARPNVVVVRAENCPHVKQLHLLHVQVLYSSLAHVSSLQMPSLRRLPVPLVNRSVLRHFHAPALEEVTLQGMVIDTQVLQPALMCSPEQWKELQECVRTLPSDNSEANVPPSSDVALAPARTAEERVGSRHSKPVPPPQLLIAAFIDCTFTDPKELECFLHQQRALLRLSTHNCRGLMDGHMAQLPSTLLDLDVGLVSSLSDAALQEIVVAAPSLARLNVKRAGALISDTGIHSLHGLTSLRELNVLGLDADRVSGSAVAGVAMALPHLLRLYHETAVVVQGGASAPGRAACSEYLCVYRTDEENRLERELQGLPRELIRLRNHASLALWMEGRLPKPSTLLPVAAARTAASAATHSATALAYTPRPPMSSTSMFMRTNKDPSTGGYRTHSTSPLLNVAIPPATRSAPTLERPNNDAVAKVCEEHDVAMPNELNTPPDVKSAPISSNSSEASRGGSPTHQAVWCEMHEKAVAESMGPWGDTDALS